MSSINAARGALLVAIAGLVCLGLPLGDRGLVRAERQLQQATTNLSFTGLGLQPLILSLEQQNALRLRVRTHSLLLGYLRRARAVRANLSRTLNGTALKAAIRAAFAAELTTLTTAGATANPSASSSSLSSTSNAALDSLYSAQALSASVDTVASDTPLPDAWDSRTTGVLPAVRNQGQCGTCVAFSSTTTMVTTMASVQGVAGTSLPVLSPQWLYFCSGIEANITCNTGMVLSVTDLAIPDVGIQYDQCYPYNPALGAGACPLGPQQCSGSLGPGGFWSSVNYYENSAFPLFQTSSAQAILNIKQHIVTYGAVAGSFYVDNQFQNYGPNSPIIQQSPPWNTNNGHAVAVVGYNDSAPIPYWIGQNSWGTGWGQQGYFLIAYNGTALMNIDGLGFNYSATNNIAANASFTTAVMRCEATFYSGANLGGTSVAIQSGAIQVSTPATVWSYPNLTLSGSDYSSQSWANTIRSYNLSCGCKNTGSCFELAQGIVWTYFQLPNTTNTNPNPSGTVGFSQTTCNAGLSCSVTGNLPAAFQANTQSMVFSWTPQTSGIIGNGTFLPPPAPAAPKLPEPSNWLMTALACLVVTVFYMLLPQ